MTKSKFNQLLGSGDTKGAIQLLIDEDVNDARLLMSRYNELKRNESMGLVGYTTANMHMNQIRYATAELAKSVKWQTAEYVDIPSFNVSQAAPEHAPAPKGSSAVSELELLLASPRLSTVSQLPALAARLMDVSNWLEAFGEEEFDDVAGEFRALARTVAKNKLDQQPALFEEAKELCAAAIELTLALQQPTGTAAIIEAGKASGSTEEQILAAAKAIGKEKLNEVKLILAQSTNKVVGRIQARKAL